MTFEDELKEIVNERTANKIGKLASAIESQTINGGNVNIRVGKEIFKPDIANEFVLLFAESFYEIVLVSNLNVTDIKVMLKLIIYAQFGNLLSFSQATLAKDIGINKSNVSKSIKKLKESALLVEVNGNLFLNPQIINKGSLGKIVKEKQELIKAGEDAMRNAFGDKMRQGILNFQ